MIIFAGITSGMGLYFLSRCALRIERGHSSFFSVAHRTYPSGAVVFDSAIAIKCFGTCFIGSGSDGRGGRVVSYNHWRLDAASGGEYFSRGKVDAILAGSTILDHFFYVRNAVRWTEVD